MFLILIIVLFSFSWNTIFSDQIFGVLLINSFVYSLLGLVIILLTLLFSSIEPFLRIIKFSAISLTTGREEDENIIVVLNFSLKILISLIICAPIVTSNGIVMLSATKSFGELNNASTIIALCIIPPLYCDGYS